LFEVRESDYLSEISVLRGITPPIGQDMPILQRDLYNLNQEDGKDNDEELDIILDTRMIKEIDLSEAVLRDINKQIKDKKNVLTDIEGQMDEVSSLLATSKEEHQVSPLQELGTEVVPSSTRVEWTQDFEASNHSREGDTRILSPTIKKHGYEYGYERKLTAAEVSEPQRQAYQPYGPWGRYVFIQRRACSLSAGGGGE